MTPIQTRFGQVLRRYRETKLQLSQEALAESAGLHRNYIGLLENGKRIPSILVAEKLAAAMGISLAQLFRDVEKLK